MDVKFGDVVLAVYQRVGESHSYQTIAVFEPGRWPESSDDFVRISEPFEVTIVEAEDSHERVIRAQVAVIDDEIAAHVALIERLKGERSKLLAITHDVDA